ncbi:beta-1,3-galactosyl-O-glycosyl-glycoprotein beta-1,6-N-acetylglucosaminyltransferase-like [Pomacea canaliculata]|uniref:beta-1,3-galactosyl-O-glycosyl-glycoprotein beta-1,6-N-acetylglucosaminyltransferase-like n=1 Tax=Pomacea canaliculata TaxID=400727 RepID=UPI000D72B3A5|nr:beta-1,3-galactosyl-O-glycosyl-glycoprotein beta-1,6-N-acetylglucosaminyltransferase-like [Pomacea canaliculata]
MSSACSPSQLHRETLGTCTIVSGISFHLAVSQEETGFPLAFSLLVYRDVDQVVRLLRAIYRPHNLYCVHVDRKSNEALQASLRMVIACLPNVLLVPRAINVTWGSVTTLEPELECMRLLWKQRVKWRYFINLTGQEFPLKTNKELVHILKTFRGANDIRGTHNPDFHYRWKKHLPAPYNLTVSKGSVHIVASRGFVDYVIHSLVSRELLKWVTPIYIPDEIFFSTLNHNPHLGVPGSYLGSIEEPFKATFVRYKLWNTPRFPHVQPCDGRWVRHICHFAPGDLPRMIASSKLFANKFSYDYMPAAYDCLEEWYWHRVHLENSGRALPLNLSVYATSNLVTHRYTGPVRVWD